MIISSALPPEVLFYYLYPMVTRTVIILELLRGRSYVAAGEELYKELVSSDKVILDFYDVDGVPSLFWNVSLLRLIRERGKDVLKNIQYRHITRSQAERIKDYVAKIS